jgi:hypothetical protein
MLIVTVLQFALATLAQRANAQALEAEVALLAMVVLVVRVVVAVSGAVVFLVNIIAIITAMALTILAATPAARFVIVYLAQLKVV